MLTGIEVAKFMGIPNGIIRTVVALTVIIGSTVVGTLRYAERQQREGEYYTIAAKMDTVILTNMAVVAAIEGLQRNTLDHSQVTEHTWTEAKDMFAKIIQNKEPFSSILKEKEKKMDAEQKEKLPHLNGTLSIGVRKKK